MKYILIIILLFPILSYSYKPEIKSDSYRMKNDSIIKSYNIRLYDLKKEISEVNNKYNYQDKINETTLSSISNQLTATSYNLTIFGFLFGIAALALGAYVTYIERKIVNIREENKLLLSESKNVKTEVVAINDQIQKDIYGLFLKIKRQETIHILDRLSKIPEDISNLGQQLLSRELEKEDFYILKEAYLKLKSKIGEVENSGIDEPDYLEPLQQSSMSLSLYKLLFFQHFMDLAIKDNIIGEELIDFYGEAVNSAFENDIIKSTRDFMSAIIEIGFQTKHKEINNFIKAVSASDYKNCTEVFMIIFDLLNTRDSQFKFFNIISNEKENRIGKSCIGKILIDNYSETTLNHDEKEIVDFTSNLISELEVEEKERKLAEEKERENKAERKRKHEEQKKLPR